MFELGLKIVLIGFWADLDLFDLDHGLLFPGFLLFFLLLVLELSEVHDPANRRFGVRRHFNQVQAAFHGDGQGFLGGDYSQLFAVVGDDPHLAGMDWRLRLGSMAAVIAQSSAFEGFFAVGADQGDGIVEKRKPEFLAAAQADVDAAVFGFLVPTTSR